MTIETEYCDTCNHWDNFKKKLGFGWRVCKIGNAVDSKTRKCYRRSKKGSFLVKRPRPKMVIRKTNDVTCENKPKLCCRF